jgi:AmmeMemoRadiSam system protein A
VSAPSLSAEDRRLLLQVARRALQAHFSGGTAPLPEGGPGLRAPGGAFVTLRKRDGELRGCVGMMETEEPLVETVARMAVVAARSDRRFDPLREDELPEVVVEISALGALHEIRPEEIEIGRDGLLVREGGRQGVLLPQVAAEHGWDRETFLDKTCGKAGLGAGAWRGPGAKVLAFSATVFAEEEGGGQAGGTPWRA